MFPLPAIGGASFRETTTKVIRLVRHGCTNRPFFHIVVEEHNNDIDEPCIELLGSYDPMPNKYNEKLVSLNYDRIEYWLKKNAKMSASVKEILGLSGFLPVAPQTYMRAWRYRRSLIEEIEKLGGSLADGNKAKETS